MNDISIIPLHGKTPRIHPTAFIAPGCRIIGDVEIGPDASIWYNCVLRADVNFIHVGARSNVQDGTVIHCDSAEGGMNGCPTIIEEDALVGHMAMLHGCTIRTGALVGLGAPAKGGAERGDAFLHVGAVERTERFVFDLPRVFLNRMKQRGPALRCVEG